LKPAKNKGFQRRNGGSWIPNVPYERLKLARALRKPLVLGCGPENSSLKICTSRA
jgi:hypothetical protein